METNFFGLVAVTKAALPYLRRRGTGHVINISSLAGLMGLGGLVAIIGGLLFVVIVIGALRQAIAPPEAGTSSP